MTFTYCVKYILLSIIKLSGQVGNVIATKNAARADFERLLVRMLYSCLFIILIDFTELFMKLTFLD